MMVLPVLLTDVTLNDSNKTFTVPTGFIYEVLFGSVALTTSAVAGNRQMILKVTDANDVEIMSIHAGAVQAASNTKTYNFVQGVPRDTSFVDNNMNVPLSDELIALPGYKIVIFDSGAIDAAADDMVVQLMVRKVRRF